MMARRRLAETGRWRKFDPSLEATFYAFFSHLVTPTLQYLFSFPHVHKTPIFISVLWLPAPPVSSPAEPCRGAGLNPAPGGTTPQIPDLRSGHAAAVWMVRRPVLSQHFGFISFSFLQILLCFRHIRGRNGRRGFKSHRRHQPETLNVVYGDVK